MSAALPTLRSDPLWRAPLVPVALAATLGVALDRYLSVPVPVSLIAAAAGLAVGYCTQFDAAMQATCHVIRHRIWGCRVA